MERNGSTHVKIHRLDPLNRDGRFGPIGGCYQNVDRITTLVDPRGEQLAKVGFFPMVYLMNWRVDIAFELLRSGDQSTPSIAATVT